MTEPILNWQLIFASIAAAFGHLGDGCILTAASTAYTFRWSPVRAGLIIGMAHLVYECMGLILSTSGNLQGEELGLIVSILGAIGLFFCVARHSKHIYQHHEDGSECHHHDHHGSPEPLAALSIVFVTSGDAFFAGVGIPAVFGEMERISFFISACITSATVGGMTAALMGAAWKSENVLSPLSRRRFRFLSLALAYGFVGWLFLTSVLKLLTHHQ